jgi:hypothetical protein
VTLVTGSMVPVAVMLFWMFPRSTRAVWIDTFCSSWQLLNNVTSMPKTIILK